MKIFTAAALSCSLLALMAGSSVAQDKMMKSDSMGMSKPMAMSKHDMKMMKSCQAMSHDMMMKSKRCMKMMKMHPDMMKDDAMMKH